MAFKMKGWSPFTKEDDDFGDAPRKEKVRNIGSTLQEKLMEL